MASGGSPGSVVLFFASSRASRSEIATSTPGSVLASASSEPMWSPWAWVSAIRTIGRPSFSAAAWIAFALPGIAVSTSVSPSSSSTR